MVFGDMQSHSKGVFSGNDIGVNPHLCSEFQVGAALMQPLHTSPLWKQLQNA